VSRLHADQVAALWQPQPSHTLLDVKGFTAGLYLNGRLVVEGDIPIHLTVCEAGAEFTERVEEMRKRSQSETKSIFWVAALDESIDRESVELYPQQGDPRQQGAWRPDEGRDGLRSRTRRAGRSFATAGARVERRPGQPWTGRCALRHLRRGPAGW
jgi:hypothetical protein